MRATPQETFESLQIVMSDEPTFQKLVDTVFRNMDANKSGTLDSKELTAFMVQVCDDMGIQDPPTSAQAYQVFKHLDLNGDNSVTRDELTVFLRHLFTEQMHQASVQIAKMEKQEEQERAATSLSGLLNKMK